MLSRDSDTQAHSHRRTRVFQCILTQTQTRFEESNTGNALSRKAYGPRYLMKEINEQHFLLWDSHSTELLKYANTRVVWSPLKTLTVLLVVSLRHWLLLQWMPRPVKAQKVLKHSLKEFKGSKRQKRTKLGFLCTLKRRIKYKFLNAGCYGNVTRIKALWCCGRGLKIFLHTIRKREIGAI